MNAEIKFDQKTAAKPKGGRPPKKDSQVRHNKYTIFLSEAENRKLRQMQEKTGKSPADLFRHGLFEKGLRIPKARMAPAQVMELLAAFKRKSGLIGLLAHKDKDFTTWEKDLLLGSQYSLRQAIERLERSVFISLEKADQLQDLEQVLHQIEQIRDNFKGNDPITSLQIRQLDKLFEKAKQLLQLYYHYLTLV